jgi:heat shock protein HtpX
MGRLVVRTLMFLVGLALFALYLGLAALGYLLAVSLWAQRPPLVQVVLFLGLFTLLSGYLSYRFGTSRLLADLGASDLPREYAPGVHARLDRLSETMDVDRPRLLVGTLGGPNALAVETRGGAVVLDQSLFRLLDAAELEGILAHELAHLESNDSLVQTLAYSLLRTLVGLVVLLVAPVTFLLAGFARAVAWMAGRPLEWSRSGLGTVRTRIAQALVLVLVSLTLLVRAHSRHREYAADERAVEVTGDPLALARALRRIQRASEPAHGLLSPLSVHGDEDGSLTRLLSTHPPIDDRIERLVGRTDATTRIEVG